MFESFCAKYSHTFDHLPFGIFSVKRLMASSVCACSVKCCLLFTVCCDENTNERERHRTKFTLGAGAVLHVPRGICLATVFNWLRHRNEAPKSALHFGLGRYRLYWNRFSVPNPTDYTPTHSNTHPHTPAHTHTPTPTHTHAHTHTHRHTPTHTDTHQYTPTHTDTHQHTPAHTNTHQHTYTHQHTHTPTHTNTHQHTPTHTSTHQI